MRISYRPTPNGSDFPVQLTNDEEEMIGTIIHEAFRIQWPNVAKAVEAVQYAENKESEGGES